MNASGPVGGQFLNNNLNRFNHEFLDFHIIGRLLFGFVGGELLD
ncbi:MAG: hypothetical protein RL609_1059, partial [Bacteroidota bacterium]